MCTTCTAHLILYFIILTIFGRKYNLLIYGLINDGLSGYLALKGIMISVQWTWRDIERSLNSRCSLSICHKKKQNSRALGWDLNLCPLKYKAGLVPTSLGCLIKAYKLWRSSIWNFLLTLLCSHLSKYFHWPSLTLPPAKWHRSFVQGCWLIKGWAVLYQALCCSHCLICCVPPSWLAP